MEDVVVVPRGGSLLRGEDAAKVPCFDPEGLCIWEGLALVAGPPIENIQEEQVKKKKNNHNFDRTKLTLLLRPVGVNGIVRLIILAWQERKGRTKHLGQNVINKGCNMFQ